MQNMLKKNKAFILENPKHITASLIWFPDFLNTLENSQVSNILDGLQEKFDLYFIFPKDLMRTIDLEKFSRLYQASGYIISEDTDQCQAFWWTLKYLRTFMGSSYVGYFLLESDRSRPGIEDMERVSMSQLNIGVMKYTRMPYSEIDALCKLPDKKNSLLSILRMPDPRGMYCTHKAVSTIIYLRPWLVDKIDDYMKGNITYTTTPGSLFLDSFEGFRFGDFLASWAIKTGTPDQYFLNMLISDAKA